MLVLPITIANHGILSKLRTKNPSFKEVDYSAYDNYHGGPIPDIERVKYSKTKNAEMLENMGKLSEAAEEWFSIAKICRSQGKERDAYLCETAAKKLLQRMHI